MPLSHTQLGLTMFSAKLLIGFWLLDVVIAEWPLNTIKVMPSTHEFFHGVIRRNVSKLKTNIMAEYKRNFYTSCVLHCAETRFCAAINFKEKAEENEINCQLTNTTKQKFDENSSEKEKVWTFRRINVDRSLAAACRGEINECWNGGTMIWDPTKPFSCLCKEGYTGELCKKGTGECSEGANTCGGTANCTNINGSSNCECKISGFFWNGQTCTDVSEILKNEPIEFDYKLREWLPTGDRTGNGKGDWSICWRATKDGWNGSTFHSNCDRKKPTLTIVQVVTTNKTYVFGGYATESWDDPGGGDFYDRFTSAPGSFLFSLRNNDDLGPFKAPLKNESETNAILRYNSIGPCFYELCIVADNAGLTNYSSADLGNIYQAPPGYNYDEPNTNSLLAGSLSFTPSEVEVLYLN